MESLEKLYLGQNKGIKLTSLPEDIIKLQVGTIGGGGGGSLLWLGSTAAPKCRTEGSPYVFRNLVQHQARAIRIRRTPIVSV